jgi:hypothetical protein
MAEEAGYGIATARSREQTKAVVEPGAADCTAHKPQIARPSRLGRDAAKLIFSMNFPRRFSVEAAPINCRLFRAPRPLP